MMQAERKRKTTSLRDLSPSDWIGFLPKHREANQTTTAGWKQDAENLEGEKEVEDDEEVEDEENVEEEKKEEVENDKEVVENDEEVENDDEEVEEGEKAKIMRHRQKFGKECNKRKLKGEFTEERGKKRMI